MSAVVMFGAADVARAREIVRRVNAKEPIHEEHPEYANNAHYECGVLTMVVDNLAYKLETALAEIADLRAQHAAEMAALISHPRVRLAPSPEVLQ